MLLGDVFNIFAKAVEPEKGGVNTNTNLVLHNFLEIIFIRYYLDFSHTQFARMNPTKLNNI